MSSGSVAAPLPVHAMARVSIFTLPLRVRSATSIILRPIPNTIIFMLFTMLVNSDPEVMRG
jgi:hypothetical protein